MRGEIDRWLVETGGILRIGARDCIQKKRGVAHVAGERAHLIEGGGERDHAEARDTAVGWLQSDDSAQGGGLSHGAAGVAPERAKGLRGGDRGSRSAARTTRHARQIPGVAGRADA